jgi:hypothetical protein
MEKDDYEHNTSFNIRLLLIIYTIVFAVLVNISSIVITISFIYVLLVFATILFFVFAPFRLPLIGKIYFYLRRGKWLHKLRRKNHLKTD